MNGALLLILLFLIRYVLLSLVGKRASTKASFFTPMQGLEKACTGFIKEALWELLSICFS